MGGNATTGQFEGRHALVTGGTSGVGLRIARRLLAGGATVTLTGRSLERGRDALRTLDAPPERARFVGGDSRDYPSLQDAVRQAGDRAGALDILVSAGGDGAQLTPFAEMRPDDIPEVLTAIWLPRIWPVHAALPALRRQGGSVLLLASDAARHPTPGESVIGAAAAGVLSFTKTAARELAPERVRVNAIAMTITADTRSWDRVFAAEDYRAAQFRKAVARFPAGRAPTADEVADVGAFLVSDLAAQVTGQTLSVNGGLSFGGW